MVSTVLRPFLIYLVVELAAVVALVATVGLGWTALVLAGTFVAGLVLAGSQTRRQLVRLCAGGAARGAVADSALVALGTALVVVPGLVTTVAGLLLLIPATRAAARPVLAAAALSGLGRRTPLVTVATVGGRWYAARRGAAHDFIDGEVIDVVDVTDEADPLPLTSAH